MDNIILGPNAQQIGDGRRPKVNLVGLRIEIGMMDLFGNKDFIHATHLAQETASENLQDMVSISPKELPRLCAEMSKKLLEMISQRYTLP